MKGKQPTRPQPLIDLPGLAPSPPPLPSPVLSAMLVRACGLCCYVWCVW